MEDERVEFQNDLDDIQVECEQCKDLLYHFLAKFDGLHAEAEDQKKRCQDERISISERCQWRSKSRKLRELLSDRLSEV